MKILRTILYYFTISGVINLGFIIDLSSLHKFHISAVCKSLASHPTFSFNFLSPKISSRCCSGRMTATLCSTISVYRPLEKLQRLQNNVARVVFCMQKANHATLGELPWLSVSHG